MFKKLAYLVLKAKTVVLFARELLNQAFVFGFPGGVHNVDPLLYPPDALFAVQPLGKDVRLQPFLIQTVHFGEVTYVQPLT